MTDVSQPAFGRRLRQLRLDRGIKQTELAGGQVSASYICRLEMGNRLPSPQALSYLATALGVAVDDLVAYHDPPGTAVEDGTDEAGSGTGRTQSVRDGSGELLALATAALHAGDARRAVELLEPRLELDLSEPEPFGWNWHLLSVLADAYGRVRNLPARVGVLRLLLSISGDWEDTGQLRGRVLADLSGEERALGQIEAALEHGKQALAVTWGSRPPERAQALMALAAAESEAGAAARAAERVPELLALADKVTRLTAAQLYWTSATVMSRQGNPEMCDRLMSRALETLDSRDDVLAWARLRMAAGVLRLRAGRVDDVARWIEEADKAVELAGEPAHAAALLSLKAWFLWAESCYQEALMTARQAEDSGLLSFHDGLRSRLLQSQCLLHVGEAPTALKAMRAVAVEAEEAGYLDLAAEAWKSLASALDRA
ncbi:helix-turn-helix transcriptional regulator [Streptacidiphilus sp. 4-A2]|nr:helix-turn-helix transcriptional regulator [Streptacidiphilus sp. 4-A2]